MTEQTAITTTQQAGFLAPVISVKDALIAYQAKKELIDGIMKANVDFGVIPGSSKPTLLKAGAEKDISFFGLRVIFLDAEAVEDWTGKDHDGEPFFYYRRTCNLYRGENLIASVDGSCNSWEKKYRYRSGQRVCPECGASAIFQSKPDRPGFYCWNKKGGCGATFRVNDERITKQEAGAIKNPDIADQVNTILKMADKRALVAATLIATGLSENFTQDIEDYIDGETFASHPSQQPAPFVEGHAVEVKTAPQPKQQPTPAPKAAADSDTFAGMLNPQMLVEAGLAENVPNAAQILNKLGCAGKSAAEFMPRVKLYRAWRDAGHDSSAAAVAAIAGEQLPE